MIQKYKNVTSKTIEMLSKWRQKQNDLATLLIMRYMFVFLVLLTPADLSNWVCFLFYQF